MLNKGTEAEPVAGDGKPRLPVQSSGFHTPTEPVKTPPNSPKSVGKQQQQIMGVSDLIELVKALTQRDEKDKPKTKEAKVIKLSGFLRLELL